MKQSIAHIAIVVKDYDEAIAFYTEKLDFTLLRDENLGKGKRWVIVAPPGAKECSLLLAKAVTKEQKAHIGNQAGGRVFLFLYTDDLWRDYHRMIARNIDFVRPPIKMDYGTVAVFEDLYGNRWDLLEPNDTKSGEFRDD
ncbi:VOC family protein [Aggregatimonas sangjinii]|uniref:VOC family protein n=1 Tax=Aggregatimonas sangjinii TaxID=2583587 RepID=A0A5B7SZI4_9FLAO|nr:VOC family protein [Aggregatimonas sangjinii]